MSYGSGAWLVIALAIILANLPFFTSRLFGIFAFKTAQKPFWAHLLELGLAYLVTGYLGYLIESSIGNVFEQHWEFYWVNLFIFLVLAFPGFTWRFLWKHAH